MKYARGQNNLFQYASLLVCFCSFATGNSKTLKTQYARHAIKLLFKVTSNTNQGGVF